MAHGLLYGASCSNGVLTFVDKAGRTICSATLKKYLTFTATQNGSSVALQKEGSGTLDNHYKYAVNGGAWQDYTLTNPGVAIPLDAGDYVEWRCTERNTMQSTSNYVRFVMTGRIEASNPITSIVYDKMSYDDIDPVATIHNTSYACYKLFLGCTALTKAPELPATNLRPNCYNTLFSGCTNLTVAPTLPATTVYSKAYSYMFQSTGITSAPSLPATNVQELAYKGMFYNCPNLVTPPPELPATSTGNNAYNQMFLGCSALTKSPVISVLSARSGSSSSGDLGSMFYGCLALNEIKCALNTVPAGDTTYAKSWTFNVAPTGDFYGDPTFPWASGVDGIPVGWEVWVLGATDTGSTATMYYNGVSETVRVGTSDWGACYSASGWAGFKTLSQMHSAGHTFGAQTAVTMYSMDGTTIATYSCTTSNDDGFTETMYFAGGTWKDLATANSEGYYLNEWEVPLTLRATADNSSVTLTQVGTLSNKFEVNTGSGWNSYTFGTVVALNNGEHVNFRCSSHPTKQTDTKFVSFSMTGMIEAHGNIQSMLSSSLVNGGYVEMYAFYALFSGCSSLVKAPLMPATQYDPGIAIFLPNNGYYHLFKETSVDEVTTRLHDGDLVIPIFDKWLEDAPASGCVFAYPDLPLPEDSASGVPEGWHRFILDAEDTGTTTSMYYHGAQVTVKLGTYSGTACYSVPGWKGFKDLDGMHKSGYSFDPQTQVTMYYNGSTVTAYSCAPGGTDGFTSTVYNSDAIGRDTGFKTISNIHPYNITLGVQTQITMYYYNERTVTAYECAANNDDGYTDDMYCLDASGAIFKSLSDQNVDGYYLTPTPWTGLKITSGTWSGDYPVLVALYKVGTLSNSFQIDDGSGWKDYTLEDVVELQKNSSLKFRRRSGTTQQSADNYLRFWFSSNSSSQSENLFGKITVSGNPYSLLVKTGFDSITTLADYPYALYRLFWQQKAIGSASGLVLPAMTLSKHCYHDLFSACDYLYSAPELPATTLAPYCYEGLYSECTRLPSWYHLLLPATKLVEGCYCLLFSGAQLINEVRIAATNKTIPNQALNGWLSGTAASGTVYAPTSLNLPWSVSGVPSGWVRRNIDDYPTA